MINSLEKPLVEAFATFHKYLTVEKAIKLTLLGIILNTPLKTFHAAVWIQHLNYKRALDKFIAVLHTGESSLCLNELRMSNQANMPWVTGEESKDSRLHLSSQLMRPLTVSSQWCVAQALAELRTWVKMLLCGSPLCPVQGNSLHIELI